jgi:uncharacterized phage-like protein YoqJ
MVINGSGHRPNKLGGYEVDTNERLIALARQELIAWQPSRVISGMALGFDQALTQAAIDLSIPFDAAVPFPGQEQYWPFGAQRYYSDLLKKAATVNIISEAYSREAMQLRNVWMVDRSNRVLALWNGTPGGTADCLAYARSIGRPITNVWPKWEGEASLDSMFI